MSKAKVTWKKFFTLVESLKKRIDHLRLPREENTRKRRQEAASRRCEAGRLERVRDCCAAITLAAPSGDVPEEFAKLTLEQLTRVFSTRIEYRTDGYLETGEWLDVSPEAVKLRAWVEAQRGAAGAAEVAERSAAARLADAEASLRGLQIPGFFPTPPAVVARMLELAGDVAGRDVLEPSAGKGDIADAVRTLGPARLDLIEQAPRLCDFLTLKGYKPECVDFLGVPAPTNQFATYDVILMNPPFEKGQDAEHVRHAYGFLRPGGRLVSVMSKGWTFRTDKKSTAFRAWYGELAEDGLAEHDDLPDDAFAGAFRETGTRVMLLVLSRMEAVERRAPAADAAEPPTNESHDEANEPEPVGAAPVQGTLF